MTSHMEKKRSVGEKAIKFRTAVANLLQAVQIRHRIPKKQSQLCDLARRASAEFRNSQLALDQLQLGGPSDAAEWLKWLWSMEGDVADETHAKIQIQLPVLADLIAVRWDDLVWSPAQDKAVPSQSGSTAEKAPSETLSHATIPATTSLVEPSSLLPASSAAPPPKAPIFNASSAVSATSKNQPVIPMEKVVPQVLPTQDSKSKPVICPSPAPVGLRPPYAGDGQRTNKNITSTMSQD